MEFVAFAVFAISMVLYFGFSIFQLVRLQNENWKLRLLIADLESMLTEE